MCSARARNKNQERYRSGHNEAVLKTVCPRGRVGSNPTLSASWKKLPFGCFFTAKAREPLAVEAFGQFGEIPKRLKGLPWKGSRSLIAARGFKSRLLRRKILDFDTQVLKSRIFWINSSRKNIKIYAIELISTTRRGYLSYKMQKSRVFKGIGICGGNAWNDARDQCTDVFKAINLLVADYNQKRMGISCWKKREEHNI